MKVKFNRMFFGPDGNRYKAGIWHTVPDGWTLPMRKVKDNPKEKEPDYKLDDSIPGIDERKAATSREASVASAALTAQNSLSEAEKIAANVTGGQKRGSIAASSI